jgi:cytochrome c oxidase subunit 4
VSEHVVSPKIYVVILLALLLGTYLTVSAALKDFGPWNIVIALTIASCKAILVILYFMHARYSSKRTQLIIVCAAFWLIILLALTATDYMGRPRDQSRLALPAPSSLPA